MSGSSTSLTCEVCQGALNRASRARTRRPVGALDSPKPPLGDGSTPASVGNGTTTPSAPADASVVALTGTPVGAVAPSAGALPEPLSVPVTRAGASPFRSVTEPSASPVGCTVPSAGGTTSWDTGLLTARRKHAGRTSAGLVSRRRTVYRRRQQRAMLPARTVPCRSAGRSARAPPDGPGSNGQQGMDRARRQPLPRAQEADLQQNGEARDRPAGPLDEVQRRLGGAAGSQHVVDDQHPVAGGEGVLVHLQGG